MHRIARMPTVDVDAFTRIRNTELANHLPTIPSGFTSSSSLNPKPENLIKDAPGLRLKLRAGNLPHGQAREGLSQDGASSLEASGFRFRAQGRAVWGPGAGEWKIEAKFGTLVTVLSVGSMGRVR